MYVQVVRVMVIYFILRYVEGLRYKAACFSSNCTSHTLECEEGRVIAINQAYFGIRRQSRNAACATADPCKTDSCCQFLHAEEIENRFMDEKNFHIAQRACTNKQTCTFDIPYDASLNYHFIYYEYECYQASRVLSMMCHDSVSSTYETYMFYDGKDREDSLNIDCSCTISSDVPSNLFVLYIQYIHLSTSTCPSFTDTLTAMKVPTPVCPSTGLQKRYDFLSNVNAPIKLTVQNLSADPNDIFWVRFSNKDGSTTAMSIECTGCGVPIAGACGRTSHLINDCYGGLGCSKFNLECKPGQKLALTSQMFLGHNPLSPLCEKGSCNMGKETTCCKYTLGDKFEKFQGAELAKLYETCTFKESCVAEPQILNPGNHTYGYYVYECIPESSVIEATSGGSVTGFQEAFFSYDGSKRSENTTLNCTCTVTSPAPVISMSVYFVNLHADSCCQVNVSSPSLNLPDSCSKYSGAGVYSAPGSVAPTPFTIDLMSMITRPTDKIIIRFNSVKGVDLDCSECTESIDEENNVCVYPEEIQDEGEDDGMAAVIAGSVIVGILVLVLLAILIFWACKKKKKREKADTFRYETKNPLFTEVLHQRPHRISLPHSTNLAF